MLFNSPVFIFIFLPLVLIGYFTLNRYHLLLAGKSWLVLASLFFYSYWNPVYLPLILASMLVNYALGTTMGKQSEQAPRYSRRFILIGGVVTNLGLLGYYKYADFFLDNLAGVTGADFEPLNLALPLAISFFTFQQVAYLVDSYQGETREYDFLNYCLFVTFFPQLIAGPIVHHGEMMPQFERLRTKLLSYKNLSAGLFIFILGLFKKVVIADTFAQWASIGFDHTDEVTFLGAWVVSLSYALQLYFDFSGYTDMAVGAARMFNIKLPLNFNSPYKALSIQDFWRRWHMTLSRWLRDYLYIALGGNRRGAFMTYINLFLTFLLGGLWHGAGWTFVIWGAMHGFGTTLHKLWQTTGIKLPRWSAWLVTFLFVNFAWVFFRAKSFSDADKILSGMLSFQGVALPEGIKSNAVTWVVVGMLLTVFAPNSMELARRFKPTWAVTIFTLILALAAIFNLEQVSEFLYFQF
ncbi:MAG: membrane-bound O-acyltransferase family protein [Desulfuromonas sp.]|nr:MAG: membrane-bound O-acyltransferase family protein [Desulfuromonas sp.]